MKIKLNEWQCSYLSNEEKTKIEDGIKSDLMRDKDKIKGKPSVLTVSLFEVPHTQSLKGTGAGDNGEELVTLTYSTAHHHNGEYNY